ncbi:MAG: YceH family protein [Burkholderiales bacterium]|nr:YceH family protein [Burkholderiales bacterium]
MPVPLLSLLETRILGVLVEKQHTVPDTYPLTLNALVAGCNQKTSRDPVLEASDAEVQAALDHLKTLTLVVESSGGRVLRYAHNVGRALGVPAQAVAILATMMLRGPQTIAELRIHGERLHKFADISSVAGFLDELATRADGALVVELPRAPGARETRWTHLLSENPAGGAAPVRAASVVETLGATSERVAVAELVALRGAVTRLEDEVAALRATVARMLAELGLPPP